MKKTFISLMLATCSVFVYSQSGTLDSSFGSNGIAIGNYTTANNSADAMVLQPDGKIIVAGATGGGGTINIGVSRYNTDGTLDNTFGANGKMNFSSGWIKSYIYDMHLQSDGKIVVGGYRYNNSEGDFLLARINVNGTLDNTFGTNGVAAFDRGGSEIAESFDIAPDGSFIISGYTDEMFTMAKVKSNGTIDQTFGENGWVMTQYDPTNTTYSKSTSINADGRIVLAGFGMDGNVNEAEYAVMAYLADGTLDNTFGNGGKVVFKVGNNNDFGLRVLQLPDGKILVGGHSYYDRWPLRYELAVVRLNANGTFDTTYGDNGVFKARLVDGENYLQDMALQPDGKLVITSTANYDNISDFGVVRATANGQLDTSFGDAGQIITDMPDYYSISYNIALQSDGKIIVSGDANPKNGTPAQFFVARYLNPVLAVQNVKNSTATLYPNPASDQITLEWKVSGKEYQAEIYNMVGQKVMTATVSTKSTINVSSLVKGNYFVRLNDGTKATTLQFIKK